MVLWKGLLPQSEIPQKKGGCSDKTVSAASDACFFLIRKGVVSAQRIAEDDTEEPPASSASANDPDWGITETSQSAAVFSSSVVGPKKEDPHASTNQSLQDAGVSSTSMPAVASAAEKDTIFELALSPKTASEDTAASQATACSEGRPAVRLEGLQVVPDVAKEPPEAGLNPKLKRPHAASSVASVPLVKALMTLKGASREEPLLVSGLAAAKQNSRRVNGLYVKTGQTTAGGRPVYKKWGAGKPTHLFFSNDKSSWRITQDLDSKGIFAKNQDKAASKPFLVQKVWKVFDGHHHVDDEGISVRVIDIDHPPSGIDLACTAMHMAFEDVHAESESASRSTKRRKSDVAKGVQVEPALKRSNCEKVDLADGAESDSVSKQFKRGKADATDGADVESTSRGISNGEICVVRVKRAHGACVLFNLVDKKQILQVTTKQTNVSLDELKGIAEVLCALVNNGATVEEVQARKNQLIRSASPQSPIKQTKPKKAPSKEPMKPKKPPADAVSKPTVASQAAQAKAEAKHKAKAKAASSSSSSSSSSSDSDSDAAAGNIKAKPGRPRSVAPACAVQEEQRYRSLVAEFNKKKAALA